MHREIAAALGIEARSLGEIHDALQQRVEADYGPLNRVEDWSIADIVAELGTKGPAGDPWNVRVSTAAADIDSPAPSAELSGQHAARLLVPSEDLEGADVVGAEIVPIIMLGLFNPAGPRWSPSPQC